eukprot:SAG22_NODE_745_length_7499_cov_2.796622_5_plen_215_part_00
MAAVARRLRPAAAAVPAAAVPAWRARAGQSALGPAQAIWLVAAQGAQPCARRRLCTAAAMPEEPERGEKPLPQRKLALRDVELRYTRSSGPGGQNVNKLDTKVDLRLHVEHADESAVPAWVKEVLLEQQRNRINTDGQLVITSQKGRSQEMNRQDALGKLQDLVTAAAYVAPPPSSKTLKTVKRHAAKANAKRLQQKKKNQQRKQGRSNKGGGW